jgi:hypothetical protein
MYTNRSVCGSFAAGVLAILLAAELASDEDLQPILQSTNPLGQVELGYLNP